MNDCNINAALHCQTFPAKSLAVFRTFYDVRILLPIAYLYRPLNREEIYKFAPYEAVGVYEIFFGNYSTLKSAEHYIWV